MTEDKELSHPYYVSKELPFEQNDFNREIVEPNTVDELPDGAVGVRCDDDFWVVAILPYSYKEKTIQEIVAEFWPDEKNPLFNPDSGDPWWDERWKKDEK